MPPKKKSAGAKKPEKQPAKQPTKKPAKKPTKKPKPRAPVNRNTNSVRVHIINSPGGEPAPPPYTGPDRGSFAFNHVFDMGGLKAQMLPPMNSGEALSASPVNRVAEIQTQTGDGIFDRFAAGVNPSMGTGSSFEAGESSSQPNNTTRGRDELLYNAMNLGMPREKAIKNSDSKLRKFITKEMRKR